MCEAVLECKGSQFVDKDYSHTIMGNLTIITNNKLRKRFSKTPKYQKNEIADHEKS